MDVILAVNGVADVVEAGIAGDDQCCAQADGAVTASQPVELGEFLPQPAPRAGAGVTRIGSIEAAIQRGGISY